MHPQFRVLHTASQNFVRRQISYITLTANGKTTELQPDNGKYSFIKESGQTTVNAVFGIYGDLNCDDKTDATDLVNMRQFLLCKGGLRLSDGDLKKTEKLNLRIL